MPVADFKVRPEHRFDLEYLVDNGRLSGWETDIEPGCALIDWGDGDFSLIDSQDRVIETDDNLKDLYMIARYRLTERRRQRDGITPKKVC